MFDGPHLSGSAKPSLNLIDDEQGSALVARLSDNRVELLGRIDVTAFSLNGLDNNTGGFCDPGVGRVEDVVNVFPARNPAIRIL